MSDHGHSAPKAAPKASGWSSDGIGSRFAIDTTATLAMGIVGMIGSLIFRRH